MKHTIQEKLLTLGIQHGRNGRYMTPKGIVIHYVGNPGSSAIGNRNYFESGSGGAGVSAHYVVGLQGEILSCVPDTECAAHAGKAYGEKWKTQAAQNNSTLIGIECCHPNADGKFNESTTSALIDLCVDLCCKYNLNPEKDIFRHYDVCGKSCPLYYVNNSTAWQTLKSDIVRAYNGNIEPIQITTIQAPVELPLLAIPIVALPSVTTSQMQTWTRNKGAADYFISFANYYYALCVNVGIDPAVAYAQFALETGFGKFGSGIINESYHNPCGMKTTAGGGDYDASAHKRFESWEEGIQAHIDHLALYAGVTGYPKENTPDPRHFPFIRGTVKNVQGLTGAWATDPQYAVKLEKLINEMRATVTTVIQPAPSMEPLKIDTPSDWAHEAWLWAAENGINDSTRPQDKATREEVAAMVYRALSKYIHINS